MNDVFPVSLPPNSIATPNQRVGWTIARDTFVKAQAGQCAICARPFTEDREPCLDHCHSTGFVRGALCRGCNSKLGWYEKYKASTDAYLAKAHEYQIKSPKPRQARLEALRTYYLSKADAA